MTLNIQLVIRAWARKEVENIFHGNVSVRHGVLFSRDIPIGVHYPGFTLVSSIRNSATTSRHCAMAWASVEGVCFRVYHIFIGERGKQLCEKTDKFFPEDFHWNIKGNLWELVGAWKLECERVKRAKVHKDMRFAEELEKRAKAYAEIIKDFR